MSQQQDFEPGHYWLQEIQSGELFVAHWSGSYWTFTGSLYVLDMPEVIGAAADPAHLLGPRIPEPDSVDLLLEALA